MNAAARPKTDARPPNIVLIVSDEERRTDWLDGMADLPAHDRLAADSLTFKQHYTHSSPCSPSRASLFSGKYLWQHGVIDNVSFAAHKALDPADLTMGQRLRDAGYESSYFGKWHISHDRSGEPAVVEPGWALHPDMEAYGYSGWSGNDRHYTGGAWTGRFFDPVITEQATSWLRAHAHDDTPWFATIALVNPHDIMWYPVDQPDYLAAHPEERKMFEFMRGLVVGDTNIEPPDVFPERFAELPANFDDDLHTKPEIQRAWREVRNTEHFVGRIDPADKRAWLRQLDYYAWLHERLDESVSEILSTLDDLGIYDDTVIVYTSDHGDACGSHGLRAKLPCVYEEVMGVPLTIKAPAVATPGATTEALSSSVDLLATLIGISGVDAVGDGANVDDLPGVDLSPVLADPTSTVRDHILMAQDSAQSDLLRNSRYAVRGFFDGRTKYARYYGIGGGIKRDGQPAGTEKLFDVDAAFDDHDHEWYDTDADPDELVNLAHDRSRRGELRDNFERLKHYEAQAGG